MYVNEGYLQKVMQLTFTIVKLQGYSYTSHALQLHHIRDPYPPKMVLKLNFQKFGHEY